MNVFFCTDPEGIEGKRKRKRLCMDNFMSMDPMPSTSKRNNETTKISIPLHNYLEIERSTSTVDGSNRLTVPCVFFLNRFEPLAQFL